MGSLRVRMCINQRVGSRDVTNCTTSCLAPNQYYNKIVMPQTSTHIKSSSDSGHDSLSDYYMNILAGLSLGYNEMSDTTLRRIYLFKCRIQVSNTCPSQLYPSKILIHQVTWVPTTPPPPFPTPSGPSSLQIASPSSTPEIISPASPKVKPSSSAISVVVLGPDIVMNEHSLETKLWCEYGGVWRTLSPEGKDRKLIGGCVKNGR